MKAQRSVSTLDPDRFRSEDLIDLSGLMNPIVSLASLTGDAPVSICIRYRRSIESGKWVGTPFPTGTNGFLYFRRSPHAHPAAGDIRFRIVRPESAHLSASERFLQGSDLLKKDGVSPWRIHLINVFQTYPRVLRKLLEEGLI